jgi:cobalt/nickel transport system permease protein
MNSDIPPFLLHSEQHETDFSSLRRVRVTFIDRTIRAAGRTVKNIYLQAENAEGKTFIYRINPYIKFISLLYMAIVLSITSELKGQLIATAFIACIYILSGMKVFDVYKKVFTVAFVFGFLVVFPASLNIITRGKIVLPLFRLTGQSHLWIYNIPAVIGITDAGLQVVLLIFLRVFNTVAFTLLIVFTTPLPSLIKSFKIVAVPDTFLLIITLAYKYIFILSGTIEETYLSLKSRLTCSLKNRNIHKLIGSRIYFIFKRSARVYENTYMAMTSRGYTGKAKLYSDLHFKAMDFISLAFTVSIGIIMIML